MAKDERKPLIPTGVVTEFGEVFEDPDGSTVPGTVAADITYTPGWSELRVQRDRELAEVAAGQRKAKDVTTLPANVVLIRRSHVNGSPEQIKQVQAANNGYRPITKDDVGQPWFKAIPPGATVLADGTITKGDTQYMVCDQQRAARNQAHRQARTNARLTAAQSRAANAGVEYQSSVLEPISAPGSRVNVR